ncbi:MAG: Minf_1886 family protein [Bythopirellula sp.]
MLDPTHPIAELLERDDRYPFDAYVFVFEALRYAQEKLGMGTEYLNEDGEPGVNLDAEPEVELDVEPDVEPDVELNTEFDAEPEAEFDAEQGKNEGQPERHVSGQELCEAMRQYAHEQYGYLAKSVLNHWSIYSTNDFGEIVFNLIDIKQMRKTPNDHREDFDNVFDFNEGFQHNFQFSLPDSSEERRS